MRGRIQGEVTITCKGCSSVVPIEIDGEWKTGDEDGMKVYSMPFVCRSCGLQGSVEVTQLPAGHTV